MKLLFTIILQLSLFTGFAQSDLKNAAAGSFDSSLYTIVKLPSPNTTNPAGGYWTYKQAEKRKADIYHMAVTQKYTSWVNPTSGGAIHITKNDEIEIYQNTFGIFQYRSDSAMHYSEAKEDSIVIVSPGNIWPNVCGMVDGQLPSVLITSEIDLRRSKAIKQVLAEVWKPGAQIYYLVRKNK